MSGFIDLELFSIALTSGIANSKCFGLEVGLFSSALGDSSGDFFGESSGYLLEDLSSYLFDD